MANAEYHRNWYHANKTRVAPKKKIRGKKLRKFIRHVLNEMKLILGCRECGYDKHPRALQFHHRDSDTKEFDVSSGATIYSLPRVFKEVEKCDVLCANCHAIHESEV